MKKLLSLTLALVLVLSLSALAFADTAPIVDNAIADVPVNIRQEFIDEAPEGHYLAGVKYVPIDDEFYKYEAIYLPLVQTAATTVRGSKYIKLYFSGLPNINIMYYRLDGTFSVPFDGSAATCVSFEHSQQYVYDNSINHGYHFRVTNHVKSYYGEAGRLTVYFDYYWDGEKRGSSSDYDSIACNPYGEIY